MGAQEYAVRHAARAYVVPTPLTICIVFFRIYQTYHSPAKDWPKLCAKAIFFWSSPCPGQASKESINFSLKNNLQAVKNAETSATTVATKRFTTHTTDWERCLSKDVLGTNVLWAMNATCHSRSYYGEAKCCP